MDKKLKIILNNNENNHGAEYQDRKVNDEGIIFDFSGRGYHVRIENIKK